MKIELILTNDYAALSKPPKFSGNSRQRRIKRRWLLRQPKGIIGKFIGFTFIK